MRAILLVPIVAVLLDCAVLEAQSVPLHKLAAPSAEFDAEFSTISGVRELRDGRVIVLDSKEKMVHLLDAQTGKAVRIGREGSGPGEYLRPNALLALPGDTTLIADFGNSRFLVLGEGGRVLGTMPLVQMKPGAGVTYSMSVRAVDGSGRFYYDLPKGLVQNEDEGTPILRLDRRTNRSDTVGYVRSAAASQRAPGTTVGNSGARFGVNAPTPFVAHDDWALAPDGSVAFIRANPYRLEWRKPSGSIVTGQVVSYERIRVDALEKEQWREQARLRGGPTLTTTGADGRTQTQRLPVPEPTSWPEYKAPFNASMTTTASFVAPDGRVWVARAVRAKHPTNEYDVFDSTGKLVERVSMPSSSRVVGFGRNSVYTTHKDKDDLLHLQRHQVAK